MDDATDYYLGHPRHSETNKGTPLHNMMEKPGRPEFRLAPPHRRLNTAALKPSVQAA
jgi:hypothetical protein